MSPAFREHAALDGANTLRLRARARWACEIHRDADIPEALAFARGHGLPALALGGGSNVVLPESLEALVLQVRTRGIDVLEDGPAGTRLRVAAGEDWHALVLHCHARGWHGLENLALIPGTVGAAPIQNIGAYGVELSAFVQELQVLDAADGRVRTVPAADCAFGYRDSLFRRAGPGRFLVLSVVLWLPRGRAPVTGYAALAAELGAGPRDPAAVLAAVIAIRRRRLPDPAVLPNAGSFFKNPVVSATVLDGLLARFPGLAHWPQPEGGAKLAAAWLVEHCGWKGHREQGVGVHEAQALVLVNHGGGTAAQLLSLAARIQASVERTFGVPLEIEPVVLG